MYTLEQIIKTWHECYGEDMTEEYAGFLDSLQARGYSDDKKDKQVKEDIWYGMTRWHIDDVKSLAPKWTDEKCHEFMERHSRRFQDRMVELGWEVLDIYVAEDINEVITIK
tara:strand:- start:358 stop:690 length:333 start_codon:yes stop_codon:yes gene_type:complete